ncbi:MAG: TonB-dependent receptor, partial [Sedimentisphaerales bacterium]|nr:TonB-dependent receptor [Sedimentisphaerales bacterium]
PRGAYAQADYKIGESVKLIAGTQWNESSQGYEDFVSRYGVIFTPFKKWGLKLLRGEAFRAPFALETDLYDVPILVGNKDLEPEIITTYETQLFYNDEKTYAAVTYFNSIIDRLIIRDTSVSPASFKNGGEQQFDGIELEAKRFLTSHWHVLGSTMYQNNKQTSDLNPSTAPNYMFKLGTGYTWDWGTMSLFYSHFGKPPRLASEVVVNPEPDALNLLSFNLCIDPSRWLDIPKGRAVMTFRIENLFDEEINVSEFNRGGHPNSLPDGPGRTFFAGMQLKF